MRRPLLIAVPLALVLAVLAGCGGKTVSATPETVIGTIAQPTTVAGPKLPQGDAAAGKTVFASASCGACHTMKAAGSTGTVGPNLDDLQAELPAIEEQVVNGGGGMPPFKGQLSDQQIADVSQYVFDSTR
jgi:mono/diheme cytochrome c family protein